MPGGDRTGPLGMGPGTGRRMGFCAGYERPGVYARGGCGMFGGGRGHRHWFYTTGAPFWARPTIPSFTSNPEWEVESLKAQAEMLKDELRSIEKRVEKLSREQKTEKQGE